MAHFTSGTESAPTMNLLCICNHDISFFCLCNSICPQRCTPNDALSPHHPPVSTWSTYSPVPLYRPPSVASSASYGSTCTGISHPPRVGRTGTMPKPMTYAEFTEQRTESPAPLPPLTPPTEWRSNVQSWMESTDIDVTDKEGKLKDALGRLLSWVESKNEDAIEKGAEIRDALADLLAWVESESVDAGDTAAELRGALFRLLSRVESKNAGVIEKRIELKDTLSRLLIWIKFKNVDNIDKDGKLKDTLTQLLSRMESGNADTISKGPKPGELLSDLIYQMESRNADLINKKAEFMAVRIHPFYLAIPDGGGLYHCPLKNILQCDHIPTRIKCYYDYNVDSHLGPFKCKSTPCFNHEYRFAASLMDHEREAHSVHGGGLPNIYPCLFTDCEHAAPGNGFPWFWEALKHMKRAHDYESYAILSQDSPSVSEVNIKRVSQRHKTLDQQGGRKRARLEL